VIVPIRHDRRSGLFNRSPPLPGQPWDIGRGLPLTPRRVSGEYFRVSPLLGGRRRRRDGCDGRVGREGVRARTLDHWASRAVLGETFWLNRKAVPVPARHRIAPYALTAINMSGLPFIAWGLVTLDVWITLFGLAVHMAGKNWFLDRMALLQDDMVAAGDPAHPGTAQPAPDVPSS
jgi:hypothetical protein